VHQKWIQGGNYELCIEDVRDVIWDMVKPADPLRITTEKTFYKKRKNQK
nr:probable serine/threonine-protein phosphatase 2A regulatory subunit B'' subunit TON2 [Tanacetum cinerariifolium]